MYSDLNKAALEKRQQDALNAIGGAAGTITIGSGWGESGNGMTIGNVVPVTTASVPQRFFENYSTGIGSQTNMAINTTPRSASMLHDFLAADLSKCSLDQLMAYGAFVKMVAAEFEDYGIDVPEELAKRQRTIGREIQRAIEQQIEQLEAEEKELQKREERRADVRTKKEKLQQALGQ